MYMCVLGYYDHHTPPMLVNDSAMPNQQLVHPSNTTWHARFDKEIQRPSLTAFITFHDYDTGKEVYRIDASLSPEVSYNKSDEITIRPNHIFAEEKRYYINLGRGVVQGKVGCGPQWRSQDFRNGGANTRAM